MSFVWINGTVGSGKTAVGRALADILPRAVFVDGDDHALPEHAPASIRWKNAMTSLLRLVTRPASVRTVVVAYPLDRAGYSRLRAACGRAHRLLLVVNLATPLAVTLRGRGGRQLDEAEKKRVRVMRSEGYHRRAFAHLTLPNAGRSARQTAQQIAATLHSRLTIPRIVTVSSQTNASRDSISRSSRSTSLEADEMFSRLAVICAVIGTGISSSHAIAQTGYTPSSQPATCDLQGITPDIASRLQCGRPQLEVSLRSAGSA
jgi:hypothetical protein